MNLATATPDVHVPAHTVEDAHQAHELVTGIVGLLRHPHRTDDVDKARGVALTALATLDRVCAYLDVVASEQLAKERATRAHLAEAAKRAAGGAL